MLKRNLMLRKVFRVTKPEKKKKLNWDMNSGSLTAVHTFHNCA